MTSRDSPRSTTKPDPVLEVAERRRVVVLGSPSRVAVAVDQREQAARRSLRRRLGSNERDPPAPTVTVSRLGDAVGGRLGGVAGIRPGRGQHLRARRATRVLAARGSPTPARPPPRGTQRRHRGRASPSAAGARSCTLPGGRIDRGCAAVAARQRSAAVCVGSWSAKAASASASLRRVDEAVLAAARHHPRDDGVQAAGHDRAHGPQRRGRRPPGAGRRSPPACRP